MRGRRTAPVLLGLAMAVSAFVVLYLGRGTTFSYDEFDWVSRAPELGLGGALDPYQGHLILVPQLLYKLILETIGSHYLTFRLLTLGAVFATVGLVFVWGRRAVGDWLALAPCLVLLVFGSDSPHLLQGNGFTVMGAVACGIAALFVLGRQSRGGDIAACLLLCLGAATYTTALPFLAGAAVLILIRTDRWRRAWVFLVPTLLYAAWRIWARNSGADLAGGEIDLANLLLVPAWSFQALGALINALSGLGFSFAGEVSQPPDPVAGPAFALAFLALIGWRVSRSNPGPLFWALCLAALSMFALQAISWIPGMRFPGSARYLFPGVAILLLISFEAARGLKFNRTVLIAVWLVCLAGVGTNLTLLKDAGALYRERAQTLTAQVTAVSILDGVSTFEAGPGSKSLEALVDPYAPSLAEIAPAEEKFGGLAFESGTINLQPESARQTVDSILLGATDPRVIKGVEAAGPCRPAQPSDRGVISELPPGGGVIVSKLGGKFTISRFADENPATLGSLKPGQPTMIKVIEDRDPTPWRVESNSSFLVCDKP